MDQIQDMAHPAPQAPIPANAAPRLASAYSELYQTCTRIMHSFVGKATNDGPDSSGTEVQQIAAHKSEILEFARAKFDYLLDAAQRRSDNCAELGNFNYKIISLGTDCLPRTVATRWGVKYPKAMGERTHPFDLSVHPYQAVCALLDTEFAGYTDPNHLQVRSNSTVSVIVNKKYNVYFNHEQDKSFQENDYALLIARYRKRIQDFYDDIGSTPPLFVINLSSNLVPHGLLEVLERKFSHTPFRLLALNTSKTAYDSESTGSDRLVLRHVPFPYDGYVWHNAVHFSTDQGRDFELKVIAAMREIVISSFPKKA